jgi:hypothetical protein
MMPSIDRTCFNSIKQMSPTVTSSFSFFYTQRDREEGTSDRRMTCLQKIQTQNSSMKLRVLYGIRILRT